MLSVDHNAKAVSARLSKLPVEVVQAVDEGLAQGALRIANTAKDKAPKGSNSHLVNAIQVEQGLGLGVRDIVARMNYARAVEEGTGPGGLPPIASISAWMKAKGMVGDARAVARSIYLKGTPAQPFMAPALAEHEARLNQQLRAVVREAMNNA